MRRATRVPGVAPAYTSVSAFVFAFDRHPAQCLCLAASWTSSSAPCGAPGPALPRGVAWCGAAVISTRLGTAPGQTARLVWTLYQYAYAFLPCKSSGAANHTRCLWCQVARIFFLPRAWLVLSAHWSIPGRCTQEGVGHSTRQRPPRPSPFFELPRRHKRSHRRVFSQRSHRRVFFFSPPLCILRHEGVPVVS